jgi:hypothetical protein
VESDADNPDDCPLWYVLVYGSNKTHYVFVTMATNDVIATDKAIRWLKAIEPEISVAEHFAYPAHDVCLVGKWGPNLIKT